jgi:hypothetical protein
MSHRRAIPSNRTTLENLGQITCSIDHAHDQDPFGINPVKDQPPFNDKAAGFWRYVRAGDTEFGMVAEGACPALQFRNLLVGNSQAVLRKPKPDVEKVSLCLV